MPILCTAPLPCPSARTCPTPPPLPDDEDDEYYLALARRNKAHPPTLPAFHAPSPGQGIRRLAESFLDSLGDDGGGP